MKIKTLLFASFTLLFANSVFAISTGYNDNLTDADVPQDGIILEYSKNLNLNKHKYTESCVKNNQCFIEFGNKKYYYKDLKNPTATKEELLHFNNVGIDKYKFDTMDYLEYYNNGLITKQDVEKQYQQYLITVNNLYKIMLEKKYYKIQILKKLHMMSNMLNLFKKILIEKKEEIEKEKKKMRIASFYVTQFLYHINKIEKFDKEIILVKDFE